MRIVAAYLASHPDTPQLVLDPAPGAGDLASFVAAALDRPPDRVPDIPAVDRDPDRGGHIDTLDREAELRAS